MESQPRLWVDADATRQAPQPVLHPASALAAVTASLRGALDEEIKATIRNGPRPIELQNGVRMDQGEAPFHLYRFAEVQSRVSAGTRASLRIPGRVLTAFVHSRSRNGTLVLGIEEDLGLLIRKAGLEVGTVWLLRALQSCLEKLPSGFNAPLAMAAVGEAPIPPLRPSVRADDLLSSFDGVLNEGQLAALEVGLRAPLGLIWGPPGTGKTTVLAALAEAHINAGRRVLLVASTNTAVDESVVRVAHRLKQRSSLSAGEVVRYGEMGARHRAMCTTPLEVGLIPPEAVKTCRLLATTAHLSFLLPDVVAGFDVVLVDEAGAMALPTAFWAAGLGQGTTTFIGDFRQLGPVVLAPSQTARHWLARDVFTACGVTAKIEADEEPPFLAALRAQHRMAPPISEIVSRVFYNGHLRTAGKVYAKPTPSCAVTEDASVTLVDTSGMATNQVSPITGEGRSTAERRRSNPEHTRLVARLLHFMGEEIPDRRPDGVMHVAVLAPYRAQVALHRATWGAEFSGKAVTAATVHTFQGGEVDTVVLDLTDAPPITLSPFFRNGNADECARLLNVALSRARHRVIVVAEVQWMMSVASSPPLRRLLTELREEAYRLPAKDLA